MKALNKKEQAELNKLNRKIQTGKATQREFLRAISLTNRDHAEVREEQKQSPYFDVVKSGSRWNLRTVLEGKPNIIHSNSFTAKYRAQDWADRMNAAANKSI